MHPLARTIVTAPDDGGNSRGSNLKKTIAGVDHYKPQLRKPDTESEVESLSFRRAQTAKPCGAPQVSDLVAQRAINHSSPVSPNRREQTAVCDREILPGKLDDPLGASQAGGIEPSAGDGTQSSTRQIMHPPTTSPRTRFMPPLWPKLAAIRAWPRTRSGWG